MLQRTQIYGPMITIIFAMFADLGRFIVLWVICLLIFSTSGYILFNELDAYKDLYSVFVVHFELSLGNWILTIYDGLSLGDTAGVVFHMFSVLLNMILMLNLVIAILSETYARLAPQRTGLYYDGLIAILPRYQYDYLFGVLIILPPPFNLITTPFILIFLCIKNLNPKVVTKVNECLTNFVFIPYAMIYTIMFVVSNLCLLPWAFVIGIYAKTKDLVTRCCQKKKRDVV